MLCEVHFLIFCSFFLFLVCYNLLSQCNDLLIGHSLWFQKYYFKKVLLMVVESFYLERLSFDCFGKILSFGIQVKMCFLWVHWTTLHHSTFCCSIWICCQSNCGWSLIFFWVVLMISLSVIYLVVSPECV